VTADGARPAVLFDVDGTLIDSNYLHVHAWYRAFNGVGLDVESWRIHRSIGMDGSTLVAILAEDADDDTRARAKDLHSHYYKETAPLLRRLPGVRELLEAVDKLGLQIVLATSAPEDELSILRGVLASDDLVSAVTSSNDVDTAKRSPTSCKSHSSARVSTSPARSTTGAPSKAIVMCGHRFRIA